jgi:uncharacterized protein YprB with RNaseH-like and TPR domain
MSRVIFDIETVGADFDSLEPSTQEYLLKWADGEEEAAKVKEGLSFYPLTAEIVCIGMLNPDSGKGVTYYQTTGEKPAPFDEDGMHYECCSEAEILEHFWLHIKAYTQFVTFNGRAFDCPFIMIRSAVHRIKPTRNLMPYRYSDKDHVDLFDQLSFLGATKRRFPLDMWCKAFGIRSPKADGITGYEVPGLYRDGRGLDIARYCAGDLRATKELFAVWENYIRTP